jgi:hypothetical protein
VTCQAYMRRITPVTTLFFFKSLLTLSNGFSRTVTTPYWSCVMHVILNWAPCHICMPVSCIAHHTPILKRPLFSKSVSDFIIIMSVPIGDIIAVGQIIYTIYNRLQDGPVELREARTQLASLQTALDTVKTCLNDPSSSLSTNNHLKASLETVIQACNRTLEELIALVDKYGKANTSKKFNWRTIKLHWRTIKFSMTDASQLAGIRANIMFHVQCINLLLDHATKYALISLLVFLIMN